MKKIFILLTLILNIAYISVAQEEAIDDKIESIVVEVKEDEVYNYLEDYQVEDDIKYSLNLEFDKYFDEDLNHFVYVKNSVNLREKPTTKSKLITKLKPKDKLKVLGLIKALDGSKWYEVVYNNQKAYLHSAYVIKRDFNWQKAIKKAEKINEFINQAIENNEKIYFINSYVSLNTETTGKKDKYGNAANQSIRAYYNDNKDYINLQDRALFKIIGEDDRYFLIKTISYGDTIYKVPKNYKKNIVESNINSEINKFIYVDRHSQTQIAIEKNKETGIFNVNSVNYVTTGISKGTGFVTPYGDYLVAYTKPIMAYVSDTEKEPILDKNGNQIGEKPIIVGDAKKAIRFSGGGYLHGIPSAYEPKENREARKKVTASKLGTIPLSHKCVRNEDDAIEYLYNWVNGKNKISKKLYTYPEENVIVMVD